MTEDAGVAAAGWSVSAGFFDYDNDGRLDLFVMRYLEYDLEHSILCGKPFHTYCRPDKYSGTTNVLFHNEGNGRFRDVSGPSGIAAEIGKGMGVAFNDYDGDGFSDIFVSNDLMEQFLFHNRGDGTFKERRWKQASRYPMTESPSPGWAPHSPITTMMDARHPCD